MTGLLDATACHERAWYMHSPVPPLSALTTPHTRLNVVPTGMAACHGGRSMASSTCGGRGDKVRRRSEGRSGAHDHQGNRDMRGTTSAPPTSGPAARAQSTHVIHSSFLTHSHPQRHPGAQAGGGAHLAGRRGRPIVPRPSAPACPATQLTRPCLVRQPGGGIFQRVAVIGRKARWSWQALSVRPGQQEL